jgi:release factor glutamine methyltransferase
LIESNISLKELLKYITKTLKPYIPRASREAQLLVMHAFGVDELWLLTNQNTTLKCSSKLLEWVERRSKNEPLEYITNSVSFYSESFYINKGALIPRPETEILIDEIIKRVEKDSTFTFVEVGIGSGIISIILAKYFENAKFIAIDISQDALEIAKINIDRFGLNDRIELRLGSLLDSVVEKIDYLVSNPPYIADDENLEINLSYEPQNALFGGVIGDEIIKKLLDEVYLRDIAYFSCEMGYDQKDKVKNYLLTKNYAALEFYKDFSDFDRGFTLSLARQ